MKRKRVAMTISVPAEMAVEYETLVEQESKNKSQLFREMFQLYKKERLERGFAELQQYGMTKAKKKKILTESEVEKIVFEGR